MQESCAWVLSPGRSLAGRLPSLVSVDFKNIFKLNAQEGSQGLEQAQLAWLGHTEVTGTRSLLVCCLPTLSERPLAQEFVWCMGDR